MKKVPPFMTCPVALLVFHLLLLLDQAQGGGLRGIQDSWLVSSSDSWYLLSPGPWPQKEILEGWTGAGVEVGQGRLFSLPELEQIRVEIQAGARIRGKLLRLTGSWEQLGGDLYRETEACLAGRMGRIPGIGFRVRYFSVRLARRQIWSGQGLDMVLGHLLRLDEESLLGGGLVLPLKSQDPPAGPPVRREFLKLWLIRNRGSLAVQVDRRDDGAPVLGCEVFWATNQGLGFSLRIDPVTGTLGPGVILRRGLLLLRTSHLIHPDLGQTHRFSLSLNRSHG